MADLSQLSRLTRKADSVAESASALVRKTMREIRGELANLSGELNLAGNAQDREKVYTEIRRRMALLSRRMNTLMEAQNEEAARGAAKSASALTGLEVKYSPSRAKAICELVTPAQGENLAAVFTDRMGRALINSLREATVGMLREQAVAGGSMADMSRDLAARWAKAANMEDPKFTDAAGRVWNTKTYIQMNVRTNTMRVYNDCLADNVARETGSDQMRISTGGDADCDCAAWEGCIISLTGKTKGLPTYEDARNGGCFHPNCTHTLEYVDETVDAAEIELQKSVPAKDDLADDYDAQDERKYEIDQARYMRDNPDMTQEQARVAVDRDNLAASIQGGLIREDAREIVAKMTDAQVTALCPNGNPPAFEPTKGTKRNPEPEKWNHGSAGGVVHIARNASAEHILEICKVTDAKDEPKPKTPEPEKEEQPKEDAETVAAREKMHSLFTDPDADSKIAGFSKEDRAVFDNIPPEMVRAYANAITKIIRSSSTSRCTGSVLEMGTSAWSNNKHTYYHEVGHALVSALQKDSEPVQKITIVPRTMGALGYVMNVPEEEKYLNTEKELRAMLVEFVAGRAAEEIVFDTVTTGAANDIEKATRVARAMVTQYGMSKRFGLVGLESAANQYLEGRTVLNCSDTTAADVDTEVIEILKEAYEEAKTLLSAHRGTLDQIADFLIKRETITGQEFMDIFHRVEGIDPDKAKAESAGRINERKAPEVIELPDTKAGTQADEQAEAQAGEQAETQTEGQVDGSSQDTQPEPQVEADSQSSQAEPQAEA